MKTEEVATQVISYLDRQREQHDFLTISELLEVVASGNSVFDLFSVLISRHCTIGTGNIFYPGVIIEIYNHGQISIGNSNTFYPQTLLVADKGVITIGSHNQFGDGGCSIKANQDSSHIQIADNGRFINGVQILGRCSFGSGSQLIGGLLTVQNCELAAGGSYEEPQPDLRGALLKGFGVARNLKLAQGQVINSAGDFRVEDIQNQSFFHPPNPSKG